jgi:hypothetical protein
MALDPLRLELAGCDIELHDALTEAPPNLVVALHPLPLRAPRRNQLSPWEDARWVRGAAASLHVL